MWTLLPLAAPTVPVFRSGVLGAKMLMPQTMRPSTCRFIKTARNRGAKLVPLVSLAILHEWCLIVLDIRWHRHAGHGRTIEGVREIT